MKHRIPHLSVSQLKLHAYSPRKWAAQYLEGLKPKATDALELGLLAHKEIEERIKKLPSSYKGNIPTEDWVSFFDYWEDTNNDWIRPGVHVWEIEKEFRVELAPHIPPFIGFIDMVCPGSSGIPFIVDHKTVSKGYVKKAEELLHDWQLSLYVMAYAFGNAPGGFHALENGLYGKSNTIVAEIAHDQLVKNSKKTFFTHVDFISTYIYPEEFLDNIENILCEAEKVLQTINLYDTIGLEAIEIGEASRQKYYGRPDPHWDYLHGLESLEEARAREEFKQTTQEI